MRIVQLILYPPGQGSELRMQLISRHDPLSNYPAGKNTQHRQDTQFVLGLSHFGQINDFNG